MAQRLISTIGTLAAHLPKRAYTLSARATGTKALEIRNLRWLRPPATNTSRRAVKAGGFSASQRPERLRDLSFGTSHERAVEARPRGLGQIHRRAIEAAGERQAVFIPEGNGICG